MVEVKRSKKVKASRIPNNDQTDFCFQNTKPPIGRKQSSLQVTVLLRMVLECRVLYSILLYKKGSDLQRLG